MIQAHINDRPDRFDLDGDGLHPPLTDGLLLLRLLFGFTGEALTEGALGEAFGEAFGNLSCDQYRTINDILR